MHEFYFSIVLIFRAVTGLGPPPGSALKPNVELELQESDLTEELQDSGNKIYFFHVGLVLHFSNLFSAISHVSAFITGNSLVDNI